MGFLKKKLNFYWEKTKFYCIHSILHADDPPHKLALGIGVGIFVTFLPLIGIQMALSVALAWLVGGNKAVGVPLVWISNPVTMIPIYYPGYWLGCKLMRIPVGGKWIEILTSNTGWLEKGRLLLESLLEVAAPLFLGTFIIALPLGIISYYVSLVLIKSYRMRRWGQLIPPPLHNPDPEKNQSGENASPSNQSDSGEKSDAA